MAESPRHSDLAELDTWPAALTVSADGHAVLDGCDLVEVAAAFGTPAWVVSQSTIEDNHDVLAEALSSRYPDVEIAYSIKANNTLAVIRLLASRGALIDTSAEYEHQLALAAGGLPSKMIINGNGKSTKALTFAAQAGVRQVNIDSPQEAGRLDEIVHSLGTASVPCMVRVHPGYERMLALDPSFSGMVTVAEGKYGSHVDGGGILRNYRGRSAFSALDLHGASQSSGILRVHG